MNLQTNNQAATTRVHGSDTHRKKLIAAIAFLAVVTGGCKTQETIRPEGYSFGKRVQAPFAKMIANAHPEPAQLDAVYFEFDSAELTDEAKQSLEAAAVQIRKEGRAVAVVGHTDIINTEHYNMQLGLERAEAVRDYLWRAGVPRDWMWVRSRGKLHPAAANLDDSNRALNRRVEIAFAPFGEGRTAEESIRMLERLREADAPQGGLGLMPDINLDLGILQ